MRGVNRVTLLGYTGKDPETRYLPNGTAVANVSIATTEQWKDKTSGEKQERTEWHRCVFFGRLGEVVAEYVKKGMPLYVEGKLRTRKWQDKTDGKDRYSTEIVCDEMQMLPNGKGNGGARQGSTPSSSDDVDMSGPQPSQSAGDFDDDIPF